MFGEASNSSEYKMKEREEGQREDSITASRKDQERQPR